MVYATLIWPILKEHVYYIPLAYNIIILELSMMFFVIHDHVTMTYDRYVISCYYHKMNYSLICDI